MDDWLKKTFDRLGRAIGEQPGYFLIVPILLSALCASGFQRVKFMADPEYLFRWTCHLFNRDLLQQLHFAVVNEFINFESKQNSETFLTFYYIVTYDHLQSNVKDV